MRVIVACEYSGRVRNAFAARGHEAYSCDLLPAEDGSEMHYQGDIFDLDLRHFDLMLAFPPCTHLAVSGARHFKKKRADGTQQAALEFVRRLLNAPVERIALENPVSIISSAIRKPDQVIHPYEFGHPEQKTTCLWLKNLPPLKPTNNVYEYMMTLPRKERERECISCRQAPTAGKNARVRFRVLRTRLQRSGVDSETVMYMVPQNPRRTTWLK